MNEEEDEKQLLDEEEDEKLLLGSRLFDQIDAGMHYVGKAVASAAEDQEGWTDDAVRFGLRGLSAIGNLPVIKQIGQLEEGIVGGVRNLAERQDVIDPRLFTYGTRIGLAFAGDKGISKLRKGAKAAALARGVKVAQKKGNIAMGLPPEGARIPDLLGDSSKVKPIAGGLQEQFTPEGLKGVLLKQIDNPNQTSLLDLATYTTPIVETAKKVARKFKPKSSVQLQTQFPWEIAQGDPKIFRSNRKGPAPRGYEILVASGKKKQRAFYKGDIELNEFSFGKKSDKYNLDRFERRILDLMEADRIEALNVPAGKFTAIPGKRKIPVSPTTLKRVQDLYADYVAGYFNQHIAGGTEVDFSKLAKLTKDGNPVIDLIDKNAKRNVLRELRLLEIDPSVYRSGAFNPSSKANKAIAAEIIEEAMNAKIRRNAKDVFKVDLHHVDQVAEGWNLYKGLDRIERGRMRELVKELGLYPGNHPKNVLRILDTFHDQLHNNKEWGWPRSKKTLAKMGFYDGTLTSIKTAKDRIEFARAYVKETKRATKWAVDRIEKRLNKAIDRQLDNRIFPSKTQELDQFGKPKSIPKSG